LSHKARWVSPSFLRADRSRGVAAEELPLAGWRERVIPQKPKDGGVNRAAGSVRPFSQLMTVH